MDLTWLYILCCIFFLLVAGYFLPSVGNKSWARIFGWTIAILTVFVSDLITKAESPLVRMIVIVVLQLLSMKILVVVETYSGNRLNIFQWSAFSLGWFGMRPILFEKLSVSLSYVNFIVKGVSGILAGLFFLYLSMIAERHQETEGIFLPQLLLLIGFSLILHFGILNLSTAAWRSMGFDVPELFKSPYRSKSLQEFWGKRWNLAFAEMTALISYRPLRARIGIEKSVTISFLLSGVLHEIAISLPVRSGYGLPMLYFVIHAAVMHAEAKSSVVRKMLAHPILCHVWVIGLLVIPLPLLFHSAFVADVLVPLRYELLTRIQPVY